MNIVDYLSLAAQEVALHLLVLVALAEGQEAKGLGTRLHLVPTIALII